MGFALRLVLRPGPGYWAPNLNAQKLEQARALLMRGHSVTVVSQLTGVLPDSLLKAIQAGKLPAVGKRPLL